MSDGKGKFVSLKARFKERLTSARRKQQILDRRIEEAHAMAIMCLRTQNVHPDAVKEALKLTDRYVSTLNDCVQVLGGSQVEITATFPDGKVIIDKLLK
ncbi:MULTISPECIES: hypothetical protein [Pseudomonas syringae group]|uniref:Prophage PssSM-01, Orf22 n=1 Tax=Pseudomonas amygdali pv. eriobotryae TaxID=129137 RepID=A0A0P9PU20_PSEA0|nr:MULTISPECIES: hypothetical protein [Pseudomonas syringae group]EPN24501.1 hypothetical protein A259_04851 [Pseudomonas syringae pv. actinidiae ICMP 19070]MDU8501428.1 hypothetical protein [Pseudomonas syringae]EGH05039.1 hypothetical protein PSYAE_24373 [Pseudomonas amygdali pv. aesculi str. 0893_23]EGH68071.1 hypothetical protein PSYAC_24833 [Pseudomonas syringae pv. actinidiae str. M302091]EPM46963.1 hypothetical protein A256_23204 [Pseudomonas syringae pv. actinidiae ICMP 19103]